MTFGIVLGGLAILGGLLYWTLSSKIRRAEAGRARMAGLMGAIGAESLDEDGQTWLFEGRRVQISILPPTLLSARLYLSVGLFTPRLFEFSLREVAGVVQRDIADLCDDPLYGRFDIQTAEPEPLRAFLNDARTRRILEKALLGRWRAFRQNYLLMTFEDNVLSERVIDETELRGAVQALRALDEGAPEPDLQGGIATVRTGFEADLPPWHWPVDALRRLPPRVVRVGASFHRDGPCLNRALAELLLGLCGDSNRPCFLAGVEDAGFVEHAFGPCFSREGRILETRNAAAVASADHFTDGAFFLGFAALPQGADATALARASRHESWDAAVASLDRASFIARRLLDDEASWYSGELEILSTRIEERTIVQAVEAMASRAGARFVPIDRRFSVKLFKDERFEYST